MSSPQESLFGLMRQGGINPAQAPPGPAPGSPQAGGVPATGTAVPLSAPPAGPASAPQGSILPTLNPQEVETVRTAIGNPKVLQAIIEVATTIGEQAQAAQAPPAPAGPGLDAALFGGG